MSLTAFLVARLQGAWTLKEREEIMETANSGLAAHLILQDSYVHPPEYWDQVLDHGLGSAAEQYREELCKEQCQESRSLISDLKRSNLKVEYLERPRDEPYNSLGIDPLYLLAAVAPYIIFRIPFFAQLQKNAADDAYPKIKDWVRNKWKKDNDGNRKASDDEKAVELHIYGTNSSMTVFRPVYTRKVRVVAELSETKTITLIIKAGAPTEQALAAFDAFYSFVQSYHQKPGSEELVSPELDGCILVEFDPQLKKLVVKDDEVMQEGKRVKVPIDKLEETIRKICDEK